MRARAHIEAGLIEKAGSDASFRALLKNDPHAAIRQLSGNDPVPGMKITVVEEPADEVMLVLPRAIAADELPDELLDYAVGGARIDCWLASGIEVKQRFADSAGTARSANSTSTAPPPRPPRASTTAGSNRASAGRTESTVWKPIFASAPSMWELQIRAWSTERQRPIGIGVAMA